jgi:hypothetical protein
VQSRLTMRAEVCCVGIAYQLTTVYPAVSNGLELQASFSVLYISSFTHIWRHRGVRYGQ